MIQLSDIHPLSHFQRNTKAYIRRLERTGKPEVLTVNGEPKLVVLDAETFQELIKKLDQADAVLGIQRGLKSMEEGSGLPADKAFAALDQRIAGKKRK